MDIDWVRSQFPVFQKDQAMVFMDNAGGSQTVRHAIEAIVKYLTEYDVQLGASYATSAAATKQLEQATLAIQTYVNAKRTEEVIVGASSTSLIRILSLCLAKGWQAGDEVIITDVDHEANRAAWVDLQQQGIVIKTWKIRPDTFELHSDDLLALMTERTQLVCFTHVSNILGTINPITEWTQLIHDHGAMACVDGVAYAPHRLIDVQAWDVDFYFFSTYKTFGPHQGVMYGKLKILDALPGFNHAFIQTTPYKFQPGNVNYELCYAMGGVVKYLCELGAGHSVAVNRADLSKAYDWIALHEATLLQKLLDYLATVPEIRIVGINNSAVNQRVATLSMVHESLASDAIVEHVDQHHIGIRFGDFYAVKLIDHLGLRDKQGVVRISLAHYNTAEEVDALIKALHEIFCGSNV
ncbi:cysteine desulfurase-like protein [Marinicella litoralis]|uniref:Cysteine desulfurase family protein (TIGR01976 family) n=1 Tax=Marinicella litoralis TaxID=644220 RepID=A0A4R6XPV9_9GAMM|nr:cysteine desulfurase-like protein [Marinicella litoralis]TDR20439.1 cysteine desulfurase family protein (TIGR01976 family) [Marinicella litoralis]